MKKIIAILLSATLLVSVLAGCGAGTSKDTSESTAEKTEASVNEEVAKPVTLQCITFSPSYNDALNELSKEYNKVATNVTISFQSYATDYWTVLKSRIASGDIPDMFHTYAYKDNRVYKDYLFDCSNEPWVKSIDEKSFVGSTLDGKILGYPLVLQGYGIIYNKKIFEDAGITTLPKTRAELEEVCKQLQAKGITPFGNGYKEPWVLHQLFNNFISKEGGDLQKLYDEFSSGTKTFKDLKYINQAFEFIDLTLKYGNTKPLETDFNGQMSLIGSGKVAMIHQGTWAESGIIKANSDVQLGFLGEPTGEEPAKLMVDGNIVWRISKDSKNLEESRKFMNWLITSDYGKGFASEKLGEISTVNGAPAPSAQLAKETVKFMETGDVLPWTNAAWPDGFEQELGKILQSYVAKDKTKDQCIDDMTKAWAKLAKAAN